MCGALDGQPSAAESARSGLYVVGPIRRQAHLKRARIQAHPYPAPEPAGLSASFGELLIESPDVASARFLESLVAQPAAAAPVGSVNVPLRCYWQGCPHAARTFTSLSGLSAHLSRHIPHRRSHYPCLWQGCARGASHPFPKRHKLVAHLRSHTMERPYTCPDCGRAFAREDSRDAHRRVHAEERRGPWGCACHGGRVWRTWRGVRRHQAGGTCQGIVRLVEVAPEVAAAAMGELCLEAGDITPTDDECDDEIDFFKH
jgi:hypothetical protein